MSIFLNLFRRNSVPASQNLLSNQRQDDESSQSESELRTKLKVNSNFEQEKRPDENFQFLYFSKIIFKDKPVKKQKVEHGKHAAQDQEKENGF